MLFRVLGGTRRNVLSVRRFSSLSKVNVYADEFRRAAEQPAAYWQEQAKRVLWFTPPPANQIMSNDENGINRWFKGGKLSAAFLATEIHSDLRPNQVKRVPPLMAFLKYDQDFRWLSFTIRP